MKKVGFFQSIHLKFVLIFLLLTLVSMEIIGVYFVNKLEEKLQENFMSSIKGRVTSLGYFIREAMSTEETNEDSRKKIQDILKDNARAEIEEIRLIDSNNVILATSDTGDQGIVGQKAIDNNVKRAINSGNTWSKRFVDNSGKRIWVLIDPIKLSSNETGYIYIVGKIESVYKEINEINSIFTKGTAIAMVITAILGIVLAQTITRPISDMRRQALAMAKGNFSRKVKVYGNDEIGQLAYSFNHMTKKLQESQATTEGERRKLSSILSHMTDGVIATDRRGKVILINEPAADMLDVSRETVLSKELVSLLKIEDLHHFEDLLNEQDSVILDYSKKDEPYILRASFSVIQSETGFVSGLITVLHDITEQEKIDMERREFVSNVSHELRTPLTTMRSYLEALADGAWEDKEIAPRFLTVTQNETERMIRLVNDLLKLSKMDSRDYQLNKEWVNIIEYFHHVIDRFEMAKEQNVTFKRKLPNADLFVEVDLDKLTQVLDNIISNALKYSPEGGQITFRARELNEMIELSISDQGMGIPKDNLKKIFERFYRVDKARTRKMGGSGLGLAIAKEMVEAHGGEIWARSEEGKGTTIYLTLPYDRSQEDEWL
ncbi:cell wall metabolism sensor histidine kinase WalK [Heyndrickxia sporothermodurans]|uniref:cell wall metabolism sensor histidine kinase WalK n=1 Tax=Heyndrickxia sporothermodurans TaxID=46224 RepID=UPI000D35DADA|nr:cell wall metabolism sensor histidine kinase WalK [Heyndrickxia sporothermodurans]PTY77550.1 cell wall metabolism sensor histidine kinase WalK [Heyndrickxia sporothermodurans]